MTMTNDPNAEVRAVLEAWATATRQNRQDDILKNHSAHVVVFDVLPPMQYEGAAHYRASWDAWQPQTQGDAVFALENLAITAGSEVAFAHGFIRCGGTLPDGRTFQDVVRVTFCLVRERGAWVVQHQHVSKPWEQA